MQEKKSYANQLDGIYPIIGLDESGKGEYLTPLTIYAFFIRDHKVYNELKEMGIGDSKNFTTKRINILGPKLLKNEDVLYKEIIIYPEKYNQLYNKMHNMNKILSWAHARAVKDLIQEIEKKYILNKLDQKIYVIGDKFSTRNYLEKDLDRLSEKISLFQYTKAESHLAVAAASILAKFSVNYFLTKKAFDLYQALGCPIRQEEYDQLPIDYNSSKNFAKNMAKKYGEDILKKIVKYNFKTTQEIVGELKR